MSNENTPTPISPEIPESSNDQPATEESIEQLEAKDTSKMTPAEKKEHQKQLKKFKLKVDGREEELELDLNNEEELRKHLQLSRAAQARMQETALTKKQAEEIRQAALDLIKDLKANPRKVLADPNIGVDLKKFATDILNEELEEAQKSPEQREKEKLLKEVEEAKKKAKENEEKLQKAEFERIQAEQSRIIDEELTEALETSGLPKKPYVVKRAAELMMIALQNNIDISAKDIMPLVKKQVIEDVRDMASSAPDEFFEELVSKERINNYRKKQIEKMKAVPTKPVDVGQTSKNTEKKEVKKVKLKDFLRM